MLDGPTPPRGHSELDKAAAALNVVVDDDDQDQDPDEDEDFGVWPDNVAAVALFMRLCSQWRMGQRGPIGLDYGAIPRVAPAAGLTLQQADEALDELRVMEQEALEWFAAQRD